MSQPSARRRAFLQRSAMLSMAGVAAPWALNLATMAEAAAQSSGTTDYKALVCVFLQGGNDHANTVLPYDLSAHQAYAQARGSLALSRQSLAGTLLGSAPGGEVLALAPALAPLHAEYQSGRLAALLNIGPLVQPTSLAAYRAGSVPVPPKLFSHNDQQSMWQSYGPEGSVAGWGGRTADLLLGGNGLASLTCINAAGSAVYLAGQEAVPYMINPAGPAEVSALGSPFGMFGSAACREALRQIITQTTQPHVLASEHARITARALDVNAQLRSALAAQPALATPFNNDNPLAKQLRMVARLLQARASLGMRRQVFFVQLGGFDLHDNLSAQHPMLLGRVAEALVQFQQAVDALGLAPQVTTFTASDFGRTLSSNGDGSDHGWGAHHLVMGGAVRGRALYGQWPGAGLGGPQDVGQGRLLPTTSVQQLAVALARWMGVPPPKLTMVAPGYDAFDASTLSGLLA